MVTAVRAIRQWNQARPRYRGGMNHLVPMLLSLLAAVTVATSSFGAPPTVHSISDISQEFTFYMDGRFHRQYLKDHGRDARNWGTLSKADLSNANLLILVAGNPRVPYQPESVAHVVEFVKDGGTLLLMGDGAATMPPGQVVAEAFGAAFTTDKAIKPLSGTGELEGVDVFFHRGTRLRTSADWTPLMEDRDDRTVLATRRFGDGHVVIGSRGLFGRKPDASDPINAGWVTPMLVDRADDKTIDPSRAPRPFRAELSREMGPLTVEYHEGTAQFAEGIHEVYTEVRPHLRELMGVEPSPGMIRSMLILPTGGGGFSSGVKIAIGAWWGNFPERRYPMVELVAHEAVHSWVLPHAEPLWNEPIATWIGIKTGQRMGFPEADATLERQIDKARRLDPQLDAVDPLSEGAKRDLIWGKSYFVFEELERLHGPDAMAKYFRAKRSLLEPGRKGYSMDDCVAVWSNAVGEDLFPWFQSLAFDVDAGRTDIAVP